MPARNSIFSVLVLLIGTLLLSCEGDNQAGDDDHDDHHGHAHGPITRSGAGMAVTHANEEKGIQLSSRALETMDASFAPLNEYREGENSYRVPRQALVNFRFDHLVYLKRDNWIAPVRVIVKEGGNGLITISFATADVQTDALIAVQGAGRVRLAYIEAFGASGEGHGH